MRRLLIAMGMLLSSYSLEAQRLVLESKAAFSISVYNAFPAGKAEISKGSFVYPSLLANFKQGYGLGVEYTREFKPWLDAGLSYTGTVFSDWRYDATNESFRNAHAGIHAVSLIGAVKTRFHERGIFNKVKIYGALAPGAYLLLLTTPEQAVTSINALQPGLLTSARIEYAIRNYLAISLNGGYHIVKVNSATYQEKSFQWAQTGISITFRLNRNYDYLRTVYE